MRINWHGAFALALLSVSAGLTLWGMMYFLLALPVLLR